MWRDEPAAPLTASCSHTPQDHWGEEGGLEYSSRQSGPTMSFLWNTWPDLHSNYRVYYVVNGTWADPVDDYGRWLWGSSWGRPTHFVEVVELYVVGAGFTRGRVTWWTRGVPLLLESAAGVHASSHQILSPSQQLGYTFQTRKFSGAMTPLCRQG